MPGGKRWRRPKDVSAHGLPVGGTGSMLHATVGTASVKGQPTNSCAVNTLDAAAAPPTTKMPSLGDVLKQANAPTPAPPVPRAGLHKAFPKETRGIKKSAALQRHEPFAQHPEWAPRDYRTQSQAAFDAPTVSRNAEKPTLSTETRGTR